MQPTPPDDVKLLYESLSPAGRAAVDAQAESFVTVWKTQYVNPKPMGEQMARELVIRLFWFCNLPRDAQYRLAMRDRRQRE